MATRIQGITIALNGDASGLEASLKGAKAETANLQKELRNINTAIKYNPQNIDLLTQKHQVLGEQIKSTEKYLDGLKQAQAKMDADGVDKNSQGYRTLQREIIQTESKLESLNKQFQQTTNWRNQLTVLGNQFTEFGQKISGIGDKFTKSLTLPMVGVATATTKLSAEFEESLAKVQTIVDGTGQSASISANKMKQQILDVSSSLGVAASDVANATYDAISAGAKAENATAEVSAAVKLQKAGFATTADSIDLLTTVMNSYGYKASDITKISDELLMTQNKGKIVVGEMAQSYGKVIPTAGAYHISLENLNATYATLTTNGIKARYATTYMNAMFNELGKSGTNVANILKQETGKSFQELMDSGYSVTDVLSILQKYCDETGTHFMDLWSSANSSKAAEKLNENAGKYKEFFNAINNSAGTTQQAFDTMEESTAAQFEKMKVNLQNLGIAVGSIFTSVLSPILPKIQNAIKGIADKINQLSPKQQQIIGWITLIIAAIGPLLSALGRVSTGIGSVMKSIASMTSINPAILAIGALAVALGALGIAAYNAGDKAQQGSEKAKNSTNAASNSISTTMSSLVQKIPQIAQQIAEGLPIVINTIVSFLSNNAGNILNAGIKLFNQIGKAVNQAMPQIASALPKIVSAIVSFLTNNIEKVLNTGINLFKSIATAISKSIPTISKNLPRIISTITQFILKNLPTVLRVGIQLFTQIVKAIPKMLPGLRKEMPQILNTAKNALKGMFGAMKAVGRDIIEGIKAGISAKLSSLKSKITNVANTVKNTIKDKLGIHSPSTVMRDEVGKNLALGLGLGFQNSMPKATAMMGNSLENSIQSLQTSSIPLTMSTNGQINGQNGYNSGATVQESHFGDITINVTARDSQSANELANVIEQRLVQRIRKEQAYG